MAITSNVNVQSPNLRFGYGQAKTAAVSDKSIPFNPSALSNRVIPFHPPVLTEPMLLLHCHDMTGRAH